MFLSTIKPSLSVSSSDSFVATTVSAMKDIFRIFTRTFPNFSKKINWKSRLTENPETMHIAGEGAALTVVELFQSQGCSSSPPSSDNIIALSTDPDLLVLTYQVTYWDHLGWKDTFGNPIFDQRQCHYANTLENNGVYTPQVRCDIFFPLGGINLSGGYFEVIVNGRVDGVGNTTGGLMSLVARGTTTFSTHIAIHDNQATVSGPKDGDGIVQLLRFDPRVQNVTIPRGENRGKTLPHKNVVTDLMVLGTWNGGKQTYRLPIMMAEGEKAAILVQAGTGGVILGAARL